MKKVSVETTNLKIKHRSPNTTSNLCNIISAAIPLFQKMAYRMLENLPKRSFEDVSNKSTRVTLGDLPPLKRLRVILPKISGQEISGEKIEPTTKAEPNKKTAAMVTTIEGSAPKVTVTSVVVTQVPSPIVTSSTHLEDTKTILDRACANRDPEFKKELKNIFLKYRPITSAKTIRTTLPTPLPAPYNPMIATVPTQNTLPTINSQTSPTPLIIEPMSPNQMPTNQLIKSPIPIVIEPKQEDTLLGNQTEIEPNVTTNQTPNFIQPLAPRPIPIRPIPEASTLLSYQEPKISFYHGAPCGTLAVQFHQVLPISPDSVFFILSEPTLPYKISDLVDYTHPLLPTWIVVGMPKILYTNTQLNNHKVHMLRDLKEEHHKIYPHLHMCIKIVHATKKSEGTFNTFKYKTLWKSNPYRNCPIIDMINQNWGIILTKFRERRIVDLYIIIELLKIDQN